MRMLADNRHLWYAYRMLRKKKSWMPERFDVIFTVDVERHTEPENAMRACEHLSRIMQRFGRGTYFMDGYIIEQGYIPEAKNFEVGLHGYRHRALGKDWWVSSEKSTDPVGEIEKAHRLIAKAYGRPVSFRAPEFSATSEINRKMKVLGYRYSSSQHPYGPSFLPRTRDGLKEFPLSRNPRPRLTKRGLQYTPLMLSVLLDVGVERMLAITREILAHWKGHENPYIMFLAHNWEFRNDEDYRTLERYLEGVKRLGDARFVSLKEHAR